MGSFQEDISKALQDNPIVGDDQAQFRVATLVNSVNDEGPYFVVGIWNSYIGFLDELLGESELHAQYNGPFNPMLQRRADSITKIVEEGLAGVDLNNTLNLITNYNMLAKGMANYSKDETMYQVAKEFATQYAQFVYEVTPAQLEDTVTKLRRLKAKPNDPGSFWDIGQVVGSIVNASITSWADLRDALYGAKTLFVNRLMSKNKIYGQMVNNINNGDYTFVEFDFGVN